MEETIVENAEVCSAPEKKPARKKMTPKQRQDLVFIVAMLIIPIVHWIIFWFIVNFNSILMAFQLPTGEWSLESLKSVFTALGEDDSELSIAFSNTMKYFVKGVIMLFFNLIVSYLLYRKVRGYRTFQVIFYLPSVISGVAISAVFSNFITPNGPLGVLLKQLGMTDVPEFLADSRYATKTLMLYTIWLGWGGNMLLFGGALARIPLELIEAGRLDGMGMFTEFTKIVFPLVWTTMSTLLILTITGIFGADGPILLFTQGNFKTTTLGYWIFDKIKYKGVSAYNQVAAMGLVFTAIGVPIAMTAKWLIEKIPTVDY